MTTKQFELIQKIMQGATVEYIYHPVLQCWMHVLKQHGFMLEVVKEITIKYLFNNGLVLCINNVYSKKL
jgi:hypothetical protein